MRGAREAVWTGIDAEHAHFGNLLAGHKGQGSFRIEPDLCRAGDCWQEWPDRRGFGARQRAQRAPIVEDGDPAFTAQPDPQLAAIAAEGEPVRLMPDQDTAGQALGVGGRPGG